MSILEQTAQVEGPQEFGQDAAGIQKRWTAELALAKKEFRDWGERVRKIVERFRSEEWDAETTDDDVSEGLNLLWSTVQTQIPAIFQFPPAVEVNRRFKTKDPAARCASMILERYLSIDMDRDDFTTEVLAVLLDRCLGARGQMWVEYEAVLGKVPQPTPVVQGPDGAMTLPDGTPYEGEPPQDVNGQMIGQHMFEQIVDCRAPASYLYWDDFLHSAARRWKDVTWVARARYYTRDQCEKLFADGMRKFGWTRDQLPLTKSSSVEKDDENANLFKRVRVWELWNDTEMIFLAESMSVPIDVRPRGVKLKTSKWPCPRPLYGTTTNATLVPVPDFVQWQDLADEVDELTTRIKYLTRACKVVGAYPAGMEGIDQILGDTFENQMVPIANWAMFKDKGGLEGAFSMLPIKDIAAVLAECQTQRQNRIDQIWQLNGIADIMRGQGDPRATATQDRIKATYGSLRLQQMQQDLGAFVERTMQIKGEIIAEKAPPEVLIEVSGISSVSEMQEHVQAGVALLKSDNIREYRIDVDERSMAAANDESEKASRQQFLTATSDGVKNVIQAAQQAPSVLDVAGEMLLWSARGFRVGRDLEGALESFVEQTRQQAEQARKAAAEAPPPPNPEKIKAENAMALEEKRHANKMQETEIKGQQDAVHESTQAQSEMAIEQNRAQAKDRNAEMESRLRMMELAFEAKLEQATAQMNAKLDAALGMAKVAMTPPPAPRPNGGPPRRQ